MPLIGFSSGLLSGGGGEEEEEELDQETCFMATTTIHDQVIINQQRHQHQNQQNHHHFINQQQIPYALMQQPSSTIPHGNFMSKESGAYDLGELDQALFLYLDGHHQEAKEDTSTNVQDHQRQNCEMRQTLNIFPSQPMHAVLEPSLTKSNTTPTTITTGDPLLVSSQPATATTTSSDPKRQPEPSADLTHQKIHHHTNNPSLSTPDQQGKAIKREGNRKGPTTSSSEQEGHKTPDPKTLRRLAQNREAARKSRLRKKAYVQQLESSRIRLTQLEQELQRARAQGTFFGGEQGLPVGFSNISSDAVVFDMEYARWVEEHHRITSELRAAVQEHLPETELRFFVDNCLAHYDQIVSLKSLVAKSDVFHLVSGMWKSPAERCFMWMGGFRPSELIKIVLSQIEPLTEQQIVGVCGLQQSTQEAEEALTQGLEALNQSLSDTIASDSLSSPTNMANYMGQMANAINKLSTVESFVRQAENLRHQTIHRLHQILTIRQAARCFLAVAEYFHRLRALSSIWLARPSPE